MSEELLDILKHTLLPVQVRFEPENDDSQGVPGMRYGSMFASSDERARIDFEIKRVEDGQTIAHSALIYFPGIVYIVDLIAKTHKVIHRGIGEFGIDSRSSEDQGGTSGKTRRTGLACLNYAVRGRRTRRSRHQG